jgi:membrane protease YdiL (CAAX protease family)
MLQKLFLNLTEGRLRAFWRIFIFNMAIIFGVILMQLLFSPNLRWGTLTNALVIIPTVYYLGKYLDQRSRNEYGVTISQQLLLESLLGFGIALSAMGILFFGSLQMGWIANVEFNLTASSLIWSHLSFLGAMVLVGIYEELWSRSYMMLNLAEGLSFKRIPSWVSWLAAAILSSVFFSALHLGNPNVSLNASINILLAGLMLAYPFWKSRRLGLSIGIHMGWNYAQGGLFGWAVSGVPVRGSLITQKGTGPEWITGGLFGPEGGLLGTLGILLVIIFTFAGLHFLEKRSIK